MRKLFPILLALLGLGGGVGAGLMLRPPAEEVVASSPCGNGTAGSETDHSTAPQDGEVPAREYVKLNNQFIVPVVTSGKVEALVILSISLEVTTGTSEKVYLLEPKLRDSFLQALFDHANSGGFDGAFTNSNTMEVLRVALIEVARKSLGSGLSDVLIVDIVRQDS